MVSLKWFVAALAFTAVTAGVSACGTKDEPRSLAAGAKLKVVATTVQIAALTKEVGGGYIELRGIVPAGADAHEFEPVASDLAAIESGNVILRHGLGLDDWLDGTLKAGKRAQLVVVTKGIKVRKVDEDGRKFDDPHVWHDPDNDKIMVKNIADALAKADPSHRTNYEANATAYQAKLDETKAKILAMINEIPPANRKLVTNHDAFAYFAGAFGLKIVGAVIPSVSTASEPSAAATAALLDTIRKENVKAIFAESSVNSGLGRTLANDAKVKIVDDLYGDSLGGTGSGAETVDAMLLVNARKIADALK